MTPRLDRMCVNFLKRIPDDFRTAFTPGGGELPDGNLIPAEQIVDYINRAMNELFGNYWQMAAGDTAKFIQIFPELICFSDAVDLTSGNYIIDTPYKHFKKIIGAVMDADNTFIKVKDEHWYTIYLSGKYDEITPSEEKPVIIQVNQLLAVFPQSITGGIKFQFIRTPLATTGSYLTQNGSEDSPFFEHWEKTIVDMAYLKYLEEINQTT